MHLPYVRKIDFMGKNCSQGFSFKIENWGYSLKECFKSITKMWKVLTAKIRQIIEKSHLVLETAGELQKIVDLANPFQQVLLDERFLS